MRVHVLFKSCVCVFGLWGCVPSSQPVLPMSDKHQIGVPVDGQPDQRDVSQRQSIAPMLLKGTGIFAGLTTIGVGVGSTAKCMQLIKGLNEQLRTNPPESRPLWSDYQKTIFQRTCLKAAVKAKKVSFPGIVHAIQVAMNVSGAPGNFKFLGFWDNKETSDKTGVLLNKLLDYPLSADELAQLTPVVNATHEELEGVKTLTPLHMFMASKPEIAEKIIKTIPNINVNVLGGGRKGSILSIAAGRKTRSADCVRLLLQLPAVNVNLADRNGITALYSAANAGNLEAYQLLLNAGANWDTVTNTEKTLLHAAAWGGSKEIVEDLLNKGLDTNKQDLNREATPLHLAAYKGHLEAVTVLLDAGARKDVTTDQGKTPEDVARDNRFEDVANSIRDYNP